MASTWGDGGDPDLELLLKSPGFWAKLGHHPYWPARAASKEEQRRYASYQRKATQVCVKFFGSNDIGWIHPASLVAFEEGMRKSFHTNAKVTKNNKFVAGVEEATRIWDDCHGPQYHHRAASPLWGEAGSTSTNGHGGPHGGGGAWAVRPPETCLACNQSRGQESGFLQCKSCGSGYHARCALLVGGGEGEPDVESHAPPRCRLCTDGGSLVLAPPPVPFRAPWSPLPGATAGAESRHQHAHAHDDADGRRGRGRPRASDSAVSLETKQRRASLAVAAAAERRARWGGGSMAESAAEWEGWGGGGNSSSDDSEYECFICKEPGMLIQCDVPNCRKVYHKPCLGLSAWGDQFFCPRHRCAVCQISEADLAAKTKPQAAAAPPAEAEAPAASTSGASDNDDDEAEAGSTAPVENKPAPSTTTKKGKKKGANGAAEDAAKDGERLWKCSCCSVAYCLSHLPAGLAPAGFKADDDSAQCFHCEFPSPRIQVATLLERSWARLATNYLALPFMRPFLHGVPRPAGEKETELVDLVGIALRIRACHYRHTDEYLDDLGTLQAQAQRFLAAAGNKPALLPVQEGLQTLVGNAKRFLEAVRREVVPAEALVEEEEAGTNGGAAVATSVAGAGGVAWRAELVAKACPIPVEFCPARTLEEWAEYVRKAPMLHVPTQQPFADGSEEAELEDLEKSEIAGVIAQLRFEDGFPHKTTLLHRDHLEAALEEQALLLRRCLEGHALLRRNIAEEKAVVLEFSAAEAHKKRKAETEAAGGGGGGGGGGEDEEGDLDDDSHVVTLGDMHILKELQIANQNLRARLESKSSLLRQREAQLWAAKRAFQDLQEQNLKLQEELAEARASSGGGGGAGEAPKDVALVVNEKRKEVAKEAEAPAKRQKQESPVALQEPLTQEVSSPSPSPAPRQYNKDDEHEEEEEQEEVLSPPGSSSPPQTASATTTHINSSSSGGSGGVEMMEEDTSTSS